MKKKNIFLIAGAVVLVVVLCVSGLHLFKGISQYKDEERKLGAKITALKRYYARDPFPSEENVRQELANVEIIDDWFDKLIEALTMDQVEPDVRKKSPSNFKNALGGKVRKLTNLAKPQEIVIPEGFAFGFERYSREAHPSHRDVPRLTQQLSIVEIVAEKLITAGIMEFVSIKRDEFEDQPATATSTASSAGGSQATASGSTSSTGRRSSRRRPSRSSRNQKKSHENIIKQQQAGLMKKGDLYAKFHFDFVFKAKEEAVVDVLNQLATLDMFVVISNIEMRKETPDVIMPVETTETAVAEVIAAATDSVVGVADSLEKEFVPRDERHVSGPEMQAPVTVILGVDVYRFRTDKIREKDSK